MTNSIRLGSTTITRWPARIPASPSPVASRPTSSSSCAQVRDCPPASTTARASGPLGRSVRDEVGHVVLGRHEGDPSTRQTAPSGYPTGVYAARVNPPPDPRRRPLNLQQRSTLAGEAAASAAEVETALDTPADPTSAAFFDVDNTVMQGASIFHLARGLHRRKFFTTREILGAAWKQAYFRIVGVEDPDHVADARNSALSFIAGHTVKELEELGEEIFDEAMAHRIWPGTRALAQLHLDQGQRVWLVTAAPIEIASIIARRLGLTGALGTVSEHIDGVYTGKLVGDLLHGPAKGEAVKALAAREGLDLARCSAYSDSYNDLPMLSLVGDPCAINPDAKLRAKAKAHGLAGPGLPVRPQGGPGGAPDRGGDRRRHRSRCGRRRRPRAAALKFYPHRADFFTDRGMDHSLSGNCSHVNFPAFTMQKASGEANGRASQSPCSGTGGTSSAG